MLFDVVLPLAGGLVLLVLGGEFLVRGAFQVVERFGVSPLLTGLDWSTLAPRRLNWSPACRRP
jgi:hypothetical protein